MAIADTKLQMVRWPLHFMGTEGQGTSDFIEIRKLLFNNDTRKFPYSIMFNNTFPFSLHDQYVRATDTTGDQLDVKRAVKANVAVSGLQYTKAIIKNGDMIVNELDRKGWVQERNESDNNIKRLQFGYTYDQKTDTIAESKEEIPNVLADLATLLKATTVQLGITDVSYEFNYVDVYDYNVAQGSLFKKESGRFGDVVAFAVLNSNVGINFKKEKESKILQVKKDAFVIISDDVRHNWEYEITGLVPEKGSTGFTTPQDTVVPRGRLVLVVFRHVLKEPRAVSKSIPPPRRLAKKPSVAPSASTSTAPAASATSVIPS